MLTRLSLFLCLATLPLTLTAQKLNPSDPLVQIYQPKPAPNTKGLLLKRGDRLAICGDSITEQKQYSVFIEDFRGKSRRGKVVPRLYLRRFLIPHFNLTFSLRDSIELESAAFEEFLINPESFDRKLRLKTADDAARLERRELGDPDQLGLTLGGSQ